MGWGILFTIVTAFVGGFMAGSFTRGSLGLGLLGLMMATNISAAFMFVPQAIWAFQFWYDIPQEVSLPWELFLASVVPFGVAAFFSGFAWLFGFALCDGSGE